MLSIAEIESKLRAIKPELTEKFHVSSIGYFGSYAKGQQTDTSDLDLVVEF
jgi:predicted nucleotidyltransferase